MKITQEADYALRMICLLAKRTETCGSPDEAPLLGAAVLAEKVAVPTRFGLKILRKLSLAGLVKASRGVSGGYTLSESADRITARQVIEAIDGPVTISRCLESDHPCLCSPDKDACRMHHVFSRLSETISERLDRLTIAMIVDESLSLEELEDTVR